MISFPWTKRVRAAQEQAARDQAVTQEMRFTESNAERQANRVIRHVEINGWTRIAKELFAS